MENEILNPEISTEQAKSVKSDGKDLFMFASSLISSVLFVLFALIGGMKIGWTITFLVFIALFSIYGLKAGKKPGFYSAVCLICSVLLSLNATLTSNREINFCSFAAAVITANIWLSGLFGKKPENTDTGLVSHFFINTFGSFTFIPKSVKSLFGTENGKSKTIKKVLIGLIIVIPVLCVVLPLLMDSDAAFRGLVGLIFAFSPVSVTKALLIILFTLLFSNYAFSLRYKDSPKQGSVIEKKGDTVILTTVTGVLSVVYIVYMLSQLAYFFSAFRSILPDGYELTYAEYARSGFFEMCEIALINLVIIFLCVVFSRKKEEKLPLSLKITCTFISAFTLLFISTAISKMMLYIKYYGMTESRICTGVFMVFLFVLFILMIVRIYTKKINVLKAGLVLVCIALSLLGIINVNTFTAKYNFNAYKTGKLQQLDIDYLFEIGPEAVPYLIEEYKTGDKESKLEAKKNLQETMLNMYLYEMDDENEKITILDKCSSAFFAENLPEIKAYRLLDELLKEDPSVCEYTCSTENDDNIYEALEGKWILSPDECEGDIFTAFGSGLKQYGAEMEIIHDEDTDGKGKISFSIGIGTGGEGFYQIKNDGEITIIYTDYNEGEEHKLSAEYSEESERIRMHFDELETVVVWQKNEEDSIENIPEGKWTISADECEGDIFTAFGSGLRQYGAEMELTPDESAEGKGKIRFSIGIGTGGEGTYQINNDGKINIKYTDYNEGEEFKLSAEYSEESERIRMYFTDPETVVVWIKQ